MPANIAVEMSEVGGLDSLTRATLRKELRGLRLFGSVSNSGL